MLVMLDLGCGPGGAAMGYHRAGFQVYGVDIEPQPNYPFEFVQRDYMEILDGNRWDLPLYFDAIHVSPPCQRYANVTKWKGTQDNHPDLLERTIELLKQQSLPWVVENVPEARSEWSVVLCGSQFGLNVRRHRGFLTSWNWSAMLSPCSDHDKRFPFVHKDERRYANAMGCPWMTKLEARQAIPPAYTEYIGHELVQSTAITI